MPNIGSRPKGQGPIFGITTSRLCFHIIDHMVVTLRLTNKEGKLRTLAFGRYDHLH